MSAAGEIFLLLCSGSLVWYFEIVLYLGEKNRYFSARRRRKFFGHFSARRRRKKIGHFSLIRYSSTDPLGQTRYCTDPLGQTRYMYCTHPSGTKVVGPTVMLAVMVYSCTHPIFQKAVMLAVMVYSCTHPISQKAVMLFTMFEPADDGIVMSNVVTILEH